MKLKKQFSLLIFFTLMNIIKNQLKSAPVEWVEYPGIKCGNAKIKKSLRLHKIWNW